MEADIESFLPIGTVAKSRALVISVVTVPKSRLVAMPDSPTCARATVAIADARY